MSVLKDNLIKILEMNDVDSLCESVICGLVEVVCHNCPYDSEENKQQLIMELQND